MTEHIQQRADNYAKTHEDLEQKLASGEIKFTHDQDWNAEKGRWVNITGPDEGPAIEELVRNWEMSLLSDCPELPMEYYLQANRKTFEDAVIEIRKGGWESAPIPMTEEELKKKPYVTHLVPWKVESNGVSEVTIARVRAARPTRESADLCCWPSWGMDIPSGRVCIGRL